jgi:hypothetical protein
MPKIEGACPDARSDATIRPWQRALQVRRPPSPTKPTPNREVTSSGIDEAIAKAVADISQITWVLALPLIQPWISFGLDEIRFPVTFKRSNASDGALKARHLPLSSTGVSQASYPVPLMERSWAIYIPLYSPYQQACSRTLLNKISLASCDTFSTWRVHPPRLVEVKSRCTSQLADGRDFQQPNPSSHPPAMGGRSDTPLSSSILY